MVYYIKSGINYSEFILNTAIVHPTIEIYFEGNIIICTQLKWCLQTWIELTRSSTFL